MKNCTPASVKHNQGGSSSVFWSAISGNVLEYYDFTVYAVFSIAIAKAFFPQQSESTQILLSLLTFSVGFITRPIGGIVFGYIGDRFGRRISLITSMLGMTIPTFTIGLIPSYEVIGYYAPITLIIMRLTQGLCISGEGTGAAIFILEHKKNIKPGLTAGLVHASGITGTLIATFIGMGLEKVFPDLPFAWRFAFLLGGFMGLVGFYLRLGVSETPIFTMLAKKKATLKAPFSHVVKHAWKAMVVTASLGAFASSIVYLVKTYIRVFYSQVLHYDSFTSLTFLSYASLVMIIAMPLSGYISDCIGKFKMIIICSVSILIFSLPALLIMVFGKFMWQQLVALTIIAALGGMISGAAYIFVISLFTPEQRFSGVNFSYNLGIAIFGGTSAPICNLLVTNTGLYYSPAFYLMSTATAVLLILYYMRNTIRNLLSRNITGNSNENSKV